MSEWFNGGGTKRSPSFMFTHSGGVDLLDFTSRDVDFDDIAHALSMQCRFNGHLKQFYSVAQHCVAVSELLEARGEPVEVQFAGLLHDAGEAYTGDITVPVQRAAGVEAVKALEEDILAAVLLKAFEGTEYVGPCGCCDELCARLTPEQWAEIHRADKDRGRVEIRDQIADSQGMVDFSDLKEMDMVVWCASPQDAASMWLRRFRKLKECLGVQ